MDVIRKITGPELVMLLFTIRYRAAVMEAKPKEDDDGNVVYDLWDQRKTKDDDDDDAAPAPARPAPSGGPQKPKGVASKTLDLDEFYRDAVPFRATSQDRGTPRGPDKT